MDDYLNDISILNQQVVFKQ